MKIDHILVEHVLRLKCRQDFVCATIAPLFIHSGKPQLSFLDTDTFIDDSRAHPSLEALFVTGALAEQLGNVSFTTIVCDEPRYCFGTLYNHIAAAGYVKRLSVIHPAARISLRAWVSEFNVTIGAGVVIEPHVTILPDVDIGENCYIHAGAVLGADGYESARTSRGIISIVHDGKLMLSPAVRIGANASLDKGIFGRDTIIGRDTTIGPLSYIAHSVQIGMNCTVTGGAVVCGSCTIGDSVTIGPNATISHMLTIGSGASIHLGAVVTRSVATNESVSGNFAIPHDRFLANLKKSLT